MKKIILILALIFSCGLTAQTKIYEIQNKRKGVISELTPANLLLIKDDFANSATSWNRYVDGDGTSVNQTWLLGYDGWDSKWKPISKTVTSNWLGLGSNAYNSTAYLPLSGGTLSGAISGTSATFSSTVTAAPATLPNHAIVKSQLDALATSGSYTPSLSDFANTSARNLVKATYFKIGDIVNVFIHLTVDVITANTDTVVTVSLPINKVNTSLYELGAGVGRLSSVNTNEFTVRTSNVTSTNNIIRLVFKPVSSGTNIVSASFSYAIN